MLDINKHSLSLDSNIKEALDSLNHIIVKNHQTLFVLNDNKLVGTLTDGDIRRGMLKGFNINDSVKKIINTSFRSVYQDEVNSETINKLKETDLFLIPILDQKDNLLRIMDLSSERSNLPIDVVIMAGGEGKRLRPLTEKLPKPLLEIGGTPIIERNVDRLNKFGIQNITITIKYLGDLIKTHFGDGSNKSMNINYVEEKYFLGTIGATSLIKEFHNESVLIMNSDLLTNIDYEDFYSYFISENADLLIASIPYEVSIPYAVLENKKGKVTSLQEKPTYTYYSNAGIYLMKKSIIEMIPKDIKFDATDLIEKLIQNKKSVISYPLRSYWLDIGKHSDFEQAQEDIKHINFN